MAQLITITSEALQASIRRLLPSQQGFGEDLNASNVITPIIDLTPTAEGSVLNTSLSQAIAFGSQTAFQIENATSVIINTAGFYRVFGTFAAEPVNATPNRLGSFTMSDGLSVKTVYGYETSPNANTSTSVLSYDFIVFLRSGDSLSGTTTGSGHILKGSTRQVADLQGNTVNPIGFVSE